MNTFQVWGALPCARLLALIVLLALSSAPSCTPRKTSNTATQSSHSLNLSNPAAPGKNLALACATNASSSLLHLPILQETVLQRRGGSSVEKLRAVIFGYAAIDGAMEKIRSLFLDRPWLNAPRQEFIVALQPEQGFSQEIRKSLSLQSCLADLEKSLRLLKEHYRELPFLLVKTPPLRVRLDTSSASLCGLRMTDVEISDLDGLSIQVRNPPDVFWALAGHLFEKVGLDVLKKAAQLMGSHLSVRELGSRVVNDVFVSTDLLQSLKTGLGCRRS